MANFTPPPLNSLDPGQDGNGFVPPPLSLLDQPGIADSEIYMPNVLGPGEERALVEQTAKERPFLYNAATTAAESLVPQSWPAAGKAILDLTNIPGAIESIKQGYDVARGVPIEQAIPGIGTLKDLETIKAQYGPDSNEYKVAAGKAAGTVLPQMIMAAAGAKGFREPSPIRTEPLQMPELPPTPSTPGPTSIGADIKRAMQENADRSLQETLATAKVPSNINIETGQPFFPEIGTQIGLPSETAQIAGLIKEKQSLEAKTAPSRAIGQQVSPVVENRIAQINQELGQPEQQPPQPPPVEIPSADRPYAGVASAGQPTLEQAVRSGGINIPRYVELIDGTQHQVAPFNPLITEGEIGLANGNIVAKSVVRKVLDENRNAIHDVATPTEPITAPSVGEPAGTSNRLNQELYGEGAVPSGTGADTGKLLDDARAALSSGKVDPYSVLSKTRTKGVANVEEYATLAAEHERLVNDAVAKQKANDPTAPEAVARANDFANAIQPHKTAASDLFRLMQGDINYDMGTPFGIEQYMKAELGRGMKASEVPKFNKMATDIRQAEAEVPNAVARADAKVQRSYAKIADISMEEAVARVKRQLADCV